MSVRQHSDLRVEFGSDGQVDLALDGGTLSTIRGHDNLVQALKLRLLIHRGELAQLGHPRYGSRVHELVGEPMTRANLELLRRFVHATISVDPRVLRIIELHVNPLPADPGAVNIYAIVEPDPDAMLGAPIEFGVILDVG